jgi:hypothetical protein
MTFSRSPLFRLLLAGAAMFLLGCEREAVQPAESEPAMPVAAAGKAAPESIDPAAAGERPPSAVAGTDTRAAPKSATAHPAESLAVRLADRSAKLWTSVGHWEAERHEEAVETLLALADTDTRHTDWRLHDVSEAEFIKLPLDKLEAHKAEMLTSYDSLRGLLRALVDRVRGRLAADNVAEIARALRVLDHIAEANQGSEVTLLAEMHGRFAEEHARRLRSALAEAQIALP